MRIILFIGLLVAVFADPGDENCAQKCADICGPCENLCRDQTIGSSQANCTACQKSCQDCLTNCHGGEINAVPKFRPPHPFQSVDYCSMCMTQCRLCKLQCITRGEDCSDCDQTCKSCAQACSSRVKRAENIPKQPVPTCEEKCASLCEFGKQEDCGKCISDCESEDGGKMSNSDTIPFGSCKKCMNYCNLWELQCKNKEKTVGCDKYKEICESCRSACSGDETQAQGTSDLIPLGSCKKCMNYCNLLELQCKDRENQVGCDKYEEICVPCRSTCSSESGDEGNPKYALPDCAQRCELICKGRIRRESRECKKCLKQCAKAGGQKNDTISSSTAGDKIATGDQKDPPPDDQCLLKCMNFCTSRKGTSLDACQDCLKQCESGGKVGSIHIKVPQRKHPDDRCIEICRGTCHRDNQGVECQKCLDNCRGVGQEKESDLGQKSSDCDDQCQEICQYGPSLGCDLCKKNCNGKSEDDVSLPLLTNFNSENAGCKTNCRRICQQFGLYKACQNCVKNCAGNSGKDQQT